MGRRAIWFPSRRLALLLLGALAALLVGTANTQAHVHPQAAQQLLQRDAARVSVYDVHASATTPTENAHSDGSSGYDDSREVSRSLARSSGAVLAAKGVPLA